MAEALTLLSDSAFRLYIYICLNADRHTGRCVVDPASLTRVLRRGPAAIENDLGELSRHGVGRRSAGVLEICERFWPYHRQPLATPDNGQADYVRSVREAFLAPACVCSVFTPADEKLTADLYQRRVPLENLRRAICLGSARKYMAMLNGQPPVPIASLGYFTALLEEVARAPVTARLLGTPASEDAGDGTAVAAIIAAGCYRSLNSVGAAQIRLPQFTGIVPRFQRNAASPRTESRPTARNSAPRQTKSCPT